MDLKAVKVIGEVTTTPGPYGTSAFGEQRVAPPYTLADFISKYGINPLEIETSVAGGAAVVDAPVASGFRLSAGAGPISRASARSASYYRYQSGRGLSITQTCVVEVAPVGQDYVQWGFYDDEDGLFWRMDAAGFCIGIRSSTSGAPVTTLIRQENWDSPSPKIDFPPFSPLKGNIYEIRLQWLGVGDIQFFINGTLVHTIHNPNLVVLPYMRTADLPISWDCRNDAGVSSGLTRLLAICGNVTVQGGESPPEFGYGVERDLFLGGIGATYVPLLAIRLAQNINGVSNRAVVYPTRVIVGCETSRTAYRVLLNPATLTGAAFNAVGGGSCMEFDIAATAFTGGTYLTGGFLPNTADGSESLLTDIFKVNARRLRRAPFTGVSDVLLVVGRNEAGGAATMRAGLQWTEVR